MIHSYYERSQFRTVYKSLNKWQPPNTPNSSNFNRLFFPFYIENAAKRPKYDSLRQKTPCHLANIVNCDPSYLKKKSVTGLDDHVSIQHSSFKNQNIEPIGFIRKRFLFSYWARALDDDHGFWHWHADVGCDNGDGAVLLQYKHLVGNKGVWNKTW